MCSALQCHFDPNAGREGSRPEATERPLCTLRITILHLGPINTWNYFSPSLSCALMCLWKCDFTLHMQGMFDRYYPISTAFESFCQHGGALARRNQTAASVDALSLNTSEGMLLWREKQQIEETSTFISIIIIYFVFRTLTKLYM